MRNLLLLIIIFPTCNVYAQISNAALIGDKMIMSTIYPNYALMGLGENSVYINSWNPNIIINSNNAVYHDVTPILGQCIFYSENGGDVWIPAKTTPNYIFTDLISAYDPAVAVDHKNRIYVNYAKNDTKYIYSDDFFSTQFIGPITLGISPTDKNHFEIDDRPIADQIELYSGWITTVSTTGNVMIASKDESQGSWNIPFNVTNGFITPLDFRYYQGVNISVAPNGDVYSTWGIYCGSGGGTASEKYIGISRSLDKGQTWTVADYVKCNDGLGNMVPLEIKGIRNNTIIPTCNSQYCASWMTMGVNQQNGDIYIVWPNIGEPCVGSNIPVNCNCSTCNSDIYFIKSTNGGVDFESPKRINPPDLRPRWNSWFAIDPYSGDIGVIYYGKNSSNQLVTFLSISIDNGVNWIEQQISDGSFNFPSSNLATTDYICLKMNNGLVVPVWSGDYMGNGYQTAITHIFNMDVDVDVSLCNPVTPYYEIIKAQNTITLSDQGCGYNIPSGSFINMYASDYIKMSEGFHASEGSKFHAHIESVVDPFHANIINNTQSNANRVSRETTITILKKGNIILSSSPNPFQDITRITVTSTSPTNVTMDLFDNMGRLVKRMVDHGSMEKGTSAYILNGNDENLNSGIYTCVVSTISEKKTIKIICIK